MSITKFSLTATLETRDYVVTVSGEIDTYTAPLLKQALQDARHTDVPRIIVDLADVTFIDSTALGVLVAAYKRSADLDISLVLLNLQPHVARVIEITGLRSMFPVTP